MRHIAREHYGMTFCEEYAMHKKNQGKITWLPATVAVIMTLVCAIVPFMLKGQDQMIVSVFAIIFGLGFLYGAVMLCVQEHRDSRSWKKIKSRVERFKEMIEEDRKNSFALSSVASEELKWDELVMLAQKVLGRLGKTIISLELMLEVFRSCRYQLTQAYKHHHKEMDYAQVTLARLKMETNQKELSDNVSKVMAHKDAFETLFNLAKYVLGNSLDNGHGFGAFMRRLEKSAKAEAIAQLA